MSGPTRRGAQTSLRRSPARHLARALVIGALLMTSVTVAGCGSAGHYIGGRIAQSVSNHVIGKKRTSEAFCVYNVYRAGHDFTHHHYLFGALNAAQAYRNCRNGFAKNAR